MKQRSRMSAVMHRFFDLLERSVIVQSLLTLSVAGVALYMFAVELTVPEALLHILWSLLGFWFGAKSQLAAIRDREKRGE